MENAQQKNKLSNYKKTISISDNDWQLAKTGRICELNVTVKNSNYLTDQFGREFHHFCTTSYLGLDYHPDISKGAIEGITLQPSASRIMRKTQIEFFSSTCAVMEDFR